MKYLPFFLFLILCACAPVTTEIDPAKVAAEEKANLEAMKSLMTKHLNAVTNRDLKTLESTLTPEGDMQLILPATEIIHSNKGFMDYHVEMFKDTVYTFDTKILNAVAGKEYGMAVTEVIFGLPERNGEPYFNRLIVSYDLKKMNGNWYVIKDHASSVEKSTDKKEEE